MIKPFRPVKVNFGGAWDGSDLAKQMAALTEQFKSWTLHMTEASGEILRDSLAPTFRKSQEYCPIRTGELRRSGYLEVRKLGVLRGYQAEIGYGRGGLPPYAVLVHEMPVYHRPPTRWKWLQAAIQEDAAEIQARIVSGYREASGT